MGSGPRALQPGAAPPFKKLERPRGEEEGE